MGARLSAVLPSSDVHASGDFEEWRACECAAEHWIAHRMLKQSSTLLRPAADRLVRRVAGGLVSHEHVLVELRCEQCGHEFGVTLEFCEDGTSMTAGRHRSLARVRRVAALRLPFRALADVYAASTHAAKEYRLLRFNCKDYAREIWAKLLAADRAWRAFEPACSL
ncbi:hypothetical protein M3Y99_01150100 [Aphelenchoides fujianensis]|nr:hypothetical protein M3Y99_01150100 [Aphelenchoides fujianensis]